MYIYFYIYIYIYITLYVNNGNNLKLCLYFEEIQATYA